NGQRIRHCRSRRTEAVDEVPSRAGLAAWRQTANTPPRPGSRILAIRNDRKSETGGFIMAEQNAADALRGVDASRRRFLGGTALAALGGIIGGVMPLSGIPEAHAQGTAPATPAPPAPPKGPQYLKFP